MIPQTQSLCSLGSLEDKMFLQNFISSRDGPGKSTETRQR